MYTLGIETSCDETAVAVIKNSKEICSNIVLSQTDLHRYFGGVIPELASRKHLEVLPNLLTDAINQAGIALKDIQLISVTQGPGLIGALLIGVSYAKALSYSLKIPVIGVNHIEAHLYANFMEYEDLSPPCIGLVVSGGHTTLVEMLSIGKYRVLGQTLDDAAGEAFDKVAKLLKLGYPGGPIIDKLSREGNPKAIRFPRAMTKHKNYNFSFSGLKTAVVYYVHPVRGRSPSLKRRDGSSRAEGRAASNGVKGYTITTADLAASFQEAAIDQLIKKTVQAVKDTGYKKLLLGGGVSRNSRLRKRFKEQADNGGWKLYLPSHEMCTDNAAMIAGLGYIKYKKNGPSSINLDADSRLGLVPRGIRRIPGT